LLDLGILQGKPEDLVKMDLHTLFFPHGIRHLLGLDVHHIEDLGDLAGYEEGTKRSALCIKLPPFKSSSACRNSAGILVSIEPGCYQVTGVLNDLKIRDQYQHLINWERLEQFADVR
jgi:Xaa-Pro aminopeptidase